MATLKKRVIIIGGGYAGVRVARDLARYGDVEIILISDSDYHVDRPLLYEVATMWLPNESQESRVKVKQGIQVLLQDIFESLPVMVKKARVKQILFKERIVELDTGEALHFDRLVLAVGAALNTFGVEGVEKHSFSLGTLDEAVALRRQVVKQLLRAEELVADERRARRMFVVVGGGATGVEAAAELVGLLSKICRARGYRDEACRVIMIEAGHHILREVSESVRTRVRQRLEELGVEVWVDAKVDEVREDMIRLVDGRELNTRTVIWSGGLKTHPLLVDAGLEVSEWGVLVNEKLQVMDQPLVFAAGDCAIVKDSHVPANAPVAYGQGAVVAKNVLHSFNGEKLERYNFRQVGRLVTLGGKWGLLVTANGRGYIGWIPWAVKRLVILRYWMSYLPWSKAMAYWWQGMKVHSGND